MTFADLARRGAKLAIDNSPTILTSIGVVGAITTAYFAGRASFQASDIIRLKEADDEERGELLTDPREIIKDRIRLVWRLYIPAGTMLTATIACIIGANHVGGRRAAGLAAAYTISEKTFDEYKAKVVEKMGAKKEDTVRDEIAQDRVTATYTDEVEIHGSDDGEICYDIFSDRYFRSSVEAIRSAENTFNYALIHDGYASLAELYRTLDIPATAWSEQIGWNSDRLLEIKIASTLTPNSKPCITVEFRQEPAPDYGRFR